MIFEAALANMSKRTIRTVTAFLLVVRKAQTFPARATAALVD